MKLNLRFLMVSLLGGALAGVSGSAFGQAALYSYDAGGNLQAVAVANPPPAFVSPPAPALLQSNSFATFSVVASGAGLAYQWLSNGVPIPGATGDSLVVGNLPLVGTNLGNFSVIVSNRSGSITSAPVALWPDANGNGIPDWWEMAYFGNLNQPASGDFDGDGVSNLDEYLEGTNPTNAASFNPRLLVQSAHGTVTVSPMQPYYTMGQFVTLTAVPEPGHEFTGWSGSVTGDKSRITVLMDTNKTITATFGFPLATALDNTNLLWTTGGDASWFGQAEVSHDGLGSAQSGPIVSTWDGANFVGEQTYLQTVSDSPQPLLLSFWWNVSSRPTNALSLAIDGVTLASISGEAVGWQFVQTNLVAGRHTLTWTYAKGPVDIPNGVGFVDSAWVDQVSLLSTNAQIVAPILSILKTTTNTVLVSWPATSTGFTLQQSSALGPANWSNVPNPVNVVGGVNQVLIVPAPPDEFFQLRSTP